MIVLDARRLTAQQGHPYLKAMLRLPDHYGENLDALHDCLTELPQTHFVFLHTEDAPEAFARFYAVFQDAALENPALTIE